MSTNGAYLALNALRVGRLFVMSTGEPLYGHQIAKQSGVNRDTVYSILYGLEEAAILTSRSETLMDAVAEKRPARRLYQLTERGHSLMRSALMSLQMAST